MLERGASPGPWRRACSLAREETGQTVGSHAARDSRRSANARRVVTEGILTRMLQRIPHRGCRLRHLRRVPRAQSSGDLGLALSLETQRHLRDSLRLLIMSATLDGEALVRLLGNAAAVRSPGRMFDVQTIHVAAPLLQAAIARTSIVQ